MNKYELTVVVTTKIEDEERAATIEKIKGYIDRFGGTVTNVDEWGKKRLAYEIQKMKEGFYYFIHFESDSVCPKMCIRDRTTASKNNAACISIR